MSGSLFARMPEERQIGRSQGDKEVTNEALSRIKIDQIVEDAEWRRTDGLSAARVPAR